MAPDIRRPETVDADWLSAVLREGGIDAEVSGFTAKAVGTGQIGDSVRFSLDYRRAPEGAPKSLVGKFPSANDESRRTGVVLGNYHREVRFYQQLAPEALVRTPRCYFTDVDEATHEFVLMMEDLAPAAQGNQLDGVTLDQARLVTIQAAKLHASFWADSRLDQLPWVSASRAAPESVVTNEAVEAGWTAFRARYAGQLEPEWIEVGNALAGGYTRFVGGTSGPRCLIHNDFRPDNMMFGTPEGGHPVTVLDWQSFSYGEGPVDLGYFLAGALSPEARRRAEPELLELYLRTLAENGVKDYGPGDLKRPYGRGGAALFFTAYYAAMLVGRTARGDEMFLQMLGGAARHVVDHGVLD
jgi:hypothetical protein